MVKPCAFCHKLFIPWRTNQKFCSDRCRLYAHYGSLKVPVKKTCPVCLVVFYTIKGNQIYCCETCHDIAHNSKQHHKKNCSFCGVEFWTTTNKKEYCSKECARKAKAERDKGRSR